ncbi:UNVERIFIED_CONTAM: hypothetical protein Slati_0959400 [Sesamum latifolium]|uniref:Uncharacterized protein n=1 Tax=Sesamum latifolium TaxID=2727402 RepID=A0AAW2XQA9_9LAMI
MEMARSVAGKALAKSFLAEAVYTAIYLLNRCPTKVVQSLNAHKAWRQETFSQASWSIGSMCYVHILTEKRHKLEEKIEKGSSLATQHSQKATKPTT